MSTILQDVRYTLRLLAQAPGFTAVAVLTLALGIGANSAMFSIVDGALLKPLPYAQPDGLTKIWTRWAEYPFGSISEPEYLDLIERAKSFESIGLVRPSDINLTDGTGEPERIPSARVSPSVLRTLGGRPLLGRIFEPDEEFTGQDRVVILGYDLWQRRFGGEPGILGTTITIGGRSCEVVGILPRTFHYPRQATQLWVPYGLDRQNLSGRSNHSSTILARLAPGVTFEQAEAELEILGAQVAAEHRDHYPEGSGFGFRLQGYRDYLSRGIQPALWTLLGAVGFVLLIACANVANLLLARIAGRGKEIALRAALGASRGRIVRQILTESVVLSCLGGVVAIAVAALASRAVLALDAGNLPRPDAIGIDGRVLAFNAVLILLAGLAFGLVPAWRVAGGDVNVQLKEGGRGAGSLRNRTRALLVTAEVALATVLLIGAGLMLRSFGELLAEEPGVRTERRLTAQITLDPGRYDDREKRVNFYRQLTDDLNARPGVVSAAMINMLPLSGSNTDRSVAAEGYSEPKGDMPDFVQWRNVTPRYFETMGIPVLQGRAFTDEDRLGSAPVAILSRSLARKFWGDRNPIGRRLRPGSIRDERPWIEVVGVVGDVRHDGLGEGDTPIWYQPTYMLQWSSSAIVVRTTTEPEQAHEILRSAVHDLDPLQPIYDVRVMDDIVDESLAGERFSGFFSARSPRSPSALPASVSTG